MTASEGADFGKGLSRGAGAAWTALVPQRASWSLPPCEDRVRRPRHLQPSRGPPAAGDLGLPASRLRGSNACCFYVFVCLFAYFYLFIFVATLVKRLSLVSSGLRSFVTVFASLRQSARGISGPPGRTGGQRWELKHLLLRQAQRHHVQPQAASRRTETRTHSHPLGSPALSREGLSRQLFPGCIRKVR